MNDGIINNFCLMFLVINLDDFKKYLGLCKIVLISVYIMLEYKL